MQSELSNENINLSNINKVFCIVGNDGTGKSTLCKFNNQKFFNGQSSIYFLQRSSCDIPKQLEPLKKQLKQLDILTFSYPYQACRKQFRPIRSLKFKKVSQNGKVDVRMIEVFWFVLDQYPQVIQQRLKKRMKVDQYDSKKAVQYYSHIYREFSWYYGFPLVKSTTVDQVHKTILNLAINSQTYEEINSLAFNSITIELIDRINLENNIQESLKQMKSSQISEIFKSVQKTTSKSQSFALFNQKDSFKQLVASQNNSQSAYNLKIKLCARCLSLNGALEYTQNEFKQASTVLNYTNLQSLKKENIPLHMLKNSPYLKVYQQGQSKILLKIYSKRPQVEKYFHNKVIILLKSTIYSHTRQHTGQIPKLGQIRALGNILFLEMIRRNNLKHSYLCINEKGIILSQLVETNDLQIIFKKQCLGTDKHSYNRINQHPEIVDSNNCYTGGVYVRFDWRNPNHFLKSKPNILLNEDPYYYVIQRFYGKEVFFKQFLSVNSEVLSMGDKCITQDLLAQYAPLDKAKTNTIKLYSTFAYYARKVGLQILDGCFMFDKTGEIGWSQINPDCMRVKSILKQQDFDKDIWRYGGSSSKVQIQEKWNAFNELFINWFDKNRFHKTQLKEYPELSYPFQTVCQQILDQNKHLSPQYRDIYATLTKTKKSKRLIGTIDISQGKPILVKSSSITQNHSQNVKNAFNYVSLLQQIVIVDIDAALSKDNTSEKNNRQLIKQILNQNRNKILGVGGGIRSSTVMDEYLNEIKCKKIILSSNLDLLDQIKKQDISSRVIVQLSVNQSNQVLVKGRSENTHVKVIDQIHALALKGVETISITFNNSQGHLKGIPRKQIIQIMFEIPQIIKNVIIAGGISTIDDLRFIWGFNRCIPQLGSAIWKHKISIGEIYQEIVTFNRDGLIPTIIVDKFDKIIGHVYIDRQALNLSCENRQLYRYSREHKKVMKKGESSGNIFNILDFKLDCDNDSLLVQVESSQKQRQRVFCHKGSYGCFDSQSLNTVSMNIQNIQNHIQSKTLTGSGYSKKMIENQGLSAIKMVQQLTQLQISDKYKVDEAADLMAHLLMYLSSHNVQMSEVLSELNRRSIDKVKLSNSTQIIQPICNKYINHQKNIKLGIICGKHLQKIDKATQQLLGIKIIRSDNRSCKIEYQTINQQLQTKNFAQSKIDIVGIKSKDIAMMISKKIINRCVNYSIMMENCPQVSNYKKKVAVPGICLALLGRKNDRPDPTKWTQDNKGTIVTQYPTSMAKYFSQLGVDEKNYTLIKVNGSTESYLVSPDCRVDYCDAIVESGSTVEDNNLVIVAVLAETIYAGFYQAI